MANLECRLSQNDNDSMGNVKIKQNTPVLKMYIDLILKEKFLRLWNYLIESKNAF